MPPLSYDEIWTHIHYLSLKEQAHLLKELAELVEARIRARPNHSILELKGLGKEIWEGIDAQEYVNEERKSWE